MLVPMIHTMCKYITYQCQHIKVNFILQGETLPSSMRKWKECEQGTLHIKHICKFIYEP